MPTGIVKWFNGRKGYGFIEPEDGGNDVFVHVTALKDSGIKFLNEGDKVSYELTENRGRMAAGNLSLDGKAHLIMMKLHQMSRRNSEEETLKKRLLKKRLLKKRLLKRLRRRFLIS